MATSARKAGWAGAALLVLTVLLLIVSIGYALWVVNEQEKRMISLEDQLSRLTSQQELIAAALNAREPTATAAADAPGREGDGASEEPSVPQGVTRVIARVLKTTPAPYGWTLQVRPGTYLLGDAAFSIASSRGQLTNSDGSFVFSDATGSVEARLVREAKVELTGWPGAKTGGTRIVTAAEFVRVMPGGASPKKPWGDGWYWLDIRDSYVLSVRQQPLN